MVVEEAAASNSKHAENSWRLLTELKILLQIRHAS